MSGIQAQAKYVRIAPRKARLVADLIRGMSVNQAEAELYLSPKRAGSHVLKLLRSAMANAKEAKKEMEKLYVKEIRVDGGPSLKRWKPRARGSAGKIEKRTSHITIILSEGKNPEKQKFVLVKKQKEPKEIHEKERMKTSKAKPAKLSEAAKEIEKKGAQEKAGKKRLFQRKSV